MSKIAEYVMDMLEANPEFLNELNASKNVTRADMVWSPPALTAEQQAEQDAYIKRHSLPF
jgi:hypothetical protein